MAEEAQDNGTAANGGRLLVYVGGLTEKPGDSTELFERLKREPGHETGEVWVYPSWLKPLTRGHLHALSNSLSDRIGVKWEQKGKPSEIVLIGHSAGGVLLRYAFLLGMGRLGAAQSGWASHVTRIVLLAAPNRGLDPARLTAPARLAAAVAGTVSQKFAVLELLAGAPFVTNLRLEWMRYFASMGATAPVVVQVSGGMDPLVEPEDGRDVVCQVNGAELRLPLARHGDIVRVSGVEEDDPGERYDTLRHAIQEHVEPNEPLPLPEDEAKATGIVILLHGIRAGIDTWVPDLKQQIDSGDGKFVVVGDSYGRFSAYNFALPGKRRRPLRWFQDQYSYYAVRHPGKPIHFVGHSNGTYMLGQSLHDVRALQFDRVYLAGSVLPREFDWRKYSDRDQIGRLVSVCATKDKPVGWLCSGLRGLGVRDIGVGGFALFNTAPPGTTQFVVDGGHGAGLDAQRLPSVARFIRDGNPPTRPEPPPSASAVFKLTSQAAPYLSWLLVAAVAGALALTVLAFSWLKLLIALITFVLIAVVLKVI